ncbi:MAG: DNA primase [Gammaproteobacteria bacterium]|nr:DNA primase [Gammaproteobacteria bacterium]
MAGKIPRSFIDDLLNRVDIVEIIDARVPLKKKGREYWACCPFHNEKSPSFSVSPNKQFYHCFGCQAHGNAISFLMDYDHMDFVEAVEALAQHLGVEVPHEQGHAPSRAEDAQAQSLYSTLEQCSRYFQDQLKQHSEAIDYLKHRGISGGTAKAFAIGFAPAGWNNLSGDPQQLLQSGMLVQNDSGNTYDRFRHRIMFPIRDRRGRTIAFGGRIINPEDNPKYLNSPESPVFHKGEEIYGLYEMKQASSQINQIFITEGYMDVVALAEHGLSTAVATLGTAINGGQIEKLFRLCKKLVFCFDADQAGRKAAWRALENSLAALKEGRIARFLFLPDGHDPDTFIKQHGQQAFLQQVTQATTLTEFLFDELLAQGETHSPEGRAELLDKLRPYYQQISLPSLKHEILRELEKRLSMKLDADLLRIIGDHPQAEITKTVIPEQHWTPTRLAINLLLQQPSLAETAGNLEELAEADIPGIDLLLQILDCIHEEPGISSQNLLSRFQGHPHEEHLFKIAAMTPAMQDEDSDIQPMFIDAIDRLRAKYADSRFQRLQQKLLNGDDLDEREKMEYSQLLKRS